MLQFPLWLAFAAGPGERLDDDDLLQTALTSLLLLAIGYLRSHPQWIPRRPLA